MCIVTRKYDDGGQQRVLRVVHLQLVHEPTERKLVLDGVAQSCLVVRFRRKRLVVREHYRISGDVVFSGHPEHHSFTRASL